VVEAIPVRIALDKTSNPRIDAAGHVGDPRRLAYAVIKPEPHGGRRRQRHKTV